VRPEKVVLIGFMGSGKTSVGRVLAERLKWDFIDTDSLVETRAGERIAQIFDSEGEKAFREWESRVIAELAPRLRLVVATGGGAPAQPANRGFFTRAGSAVFHLKVPLAVALRRTGKDTRRPLLSQDQGAVRDLYDSRLPLYDALGVPVETEGKSPAEVAEQIMMLIENPSR
jgi:shikimate kinase